MTHPLDVSTNFVSPLRGDGDDSCGFQIHEVFKHFHEAIVMEIPEVAAEISRGKLELVLELGKSGATGKVKVDEDREACGDKCVPVLFHEIHCSCKQQKQRHQQ